ncbi:MAG TPA: DNA polymerase III subunit delta [Candidatus Cybelea sp.]|nr:DNA polymerase III subunit delta [Candidatus Cybelea sp.]
MSSIDNLTARLARRKPIPAIALIGRDAYLRDLCRNAILDAYVPPGAHDWGVSRLSVRDSGWDAVFDRAQTLPMLCPCQVLFVEDVHWIERLGEEARAEIVKSLTKYFSSPAPFTVIVFEADSLDGRQKFTKRLAELALVVELTIGAESAATLAIEMARKLGAELDRSAAVLLAEIVNAEPARMHTELEKLATYVGRAGRITTSEVELLVVAARKNTVFQFADLIADRQRDAAFAFLDNLLREGESPPAIVGALAWMYRKLVEASGPASTGSGYQRQAAREGGTAGVAARGALRLSRKNLLAGLAALAEADRALKSSNPDQRATLEFLVARLTE